MPGLTRPTLPDVRRGRRVVRGLVAVGLLTLLAVGCGGSDSAEPKSSAAPDSVDGSSGAVTREDLAEAVRADFPEDSPLLGYGEIDMDEFSDCLATGLLEEVGSDRLAELDIIDTGVFSDAIVQTISTDVEEAAAFFTPFFDCLDFKPMILDDLIADGRSQEVAECVAGKALADREVRLVFILGTRDPSGQRGDIPPDWREVSARLTEIEVACETEVGQ